MADEIIVLITASNKEEASTIGLALVQEHLAACVNIIPKIRSLFIWEGKTQDEQETLLIVKSRLPLLDQLISRVRSLHSYKLPEILALPIVGGSADYLNWLSETTKK
ncbi:MAG TPA: divalent-cation tolerance protein CutA [Nitrospirota bacterium]|nr:divalent-cation tolerance protein CutA [Nitrospirota bacterium]